MKANEEIDEDEATSDKKANGKDAEGAKEKSGDKGKDSGKDASKDAGKDAGKKDSSKDSGKDSTKGAGKDEGKATGDIDLGNFWSGAPSSGLTKSQFLEFLQVILGVPGSSTMESIADGKGGKLTEFLQNLIDPFSPSLWPGWTLRPIRKCPFTAGAKDEDKDKGKGKGSDKNDSKDKKADAKDSTTKESSSKSTEKTASSQSSKAGAKSSLLQFN